MGRIKSRNFKRSSEKFNEVLEEIHLSDLIGTISHTKHKELISLSSQPIKGNKKEVPGRKYSGTADILTYDNAEYLYLTNSYAARGVNTNSSAIMRNGLEAIPTNTSNQKDLDLILQINDLDLIVYDIAKSCELYGFQFVETYQDSEMKCPRFELLPSPEMDYLRDNSNNVLYDKKTGRPQGYVQKRNGNVIAQWTGNDALRIAEFKYNTIGGNIDGIPGIQSLLYPASEYGYIRNSIADSFIRSLPVAQIKIDGATPQDIRDVITSVNDRFTARTTYVTSERFTIENSSPKNNIDVCKFIEPTLAEMAACFCMPIELLAGTQYLNTSDFPTRLQEWIEHIKVKQKMIASVFEHQIFSILFKDPVKVRFNSPVAINTSDLIKNVGFAVQSQAITQEIALEILAKSQVFGAYASSLNISKQSTTSNQKGTPTNNSSDKEGTSNDGSNTSE